jgi:hypothetical protein
MSGPKETEECFAGCIEDIDSGYDLGGLLAVVFFTHCKRFKIKYCKFALNSFFHVFPVSRTYSSDMELSLRETINALNNSSSQLEKKLGLAEDKLTLTLSRIAATDRDLRTVEETISQLKLSFEEHTANMASQQQSSAAQAAESTILDSLSELQTKFGEMMEKLGDKLSMLEKKIQAVEQWVVRTELSGSNVARTVSSEQGDVESGDGAPAVLGRKKKNKRKSGTPKQTSVHQEAAEASVVKVSGVLTDKNKSSFTAPFTG